VVSTPRSNEDEGTFEFRKQGARPFPDSATVFGLLGVLEAMVSVPVCWPVVVGAKVTVTVQLAPGARGNEHVLVWVKGPDTVTPEIVTFPLPVLVMVTIPGWHFWFTWVSGKARELVESVICAPLIPVPLSATVCGLLAALSVMVTAPVRVPVAAGVKVTPKVQKAAGATEAGQLLLVTRKSPPATMLVMVKVAVPVLVKVTVCALLVVPTCWLPKVRLLADRLAMGITPVPLKVMV
jgi:hypothetical protein